MNYFDQEGYLSLELFDPLKLSIDNLLQAIDKNVNQTEYTRLEERFKQTWEVYHSLKDLYLCDPSLVNYAKVLIDLTMTTTRLTDPMWALIKYHEKLCKKSISEVYNIQDIFKASLEHK